MLDILSSIAPIFMVLGLGYFVRKVGLLPDPFILAANRLVYNIAIPILVFSEITRGNFAENFSPRQIIGTCLAVTAVTAVALLVATALRLSPGGMATFTQTSMHGNLGYVGLAVVFYALGQEGRGAASILAGFLMLLQNVISIALFATVASPGRRLSAATLLTFVGNPIILGTVLGLILSAGGVRLPHFLDDSFSIVGDMALPTALLVIGGSLKPAPLKRIGLVGVSSMFKLLLLPMAGHLILAALGVPRGTSLIAVILLASPSATVSYVMAAEMGGKEDLAAAAVTISTLLSIATYTLWISVGG